MNDHQIAARIVYGMTASIIGAILTVVAMATGNRDWAVVAILPALAGLAAMGSILRSFRRGAP